MRLRPCAGNVNVAAVNERPPSHDGGEPGGSAVRSNWSARYAAADTPWDLGAPHPELSLRLQDGRLAPPHEGARVLVPGSGHGHDAIALARRGWDVTAVDLVGDLGDELAPQLKKLGGRFIGGDVLGLEAFQDFDLIWDHTFFCAISPSDRPRWGVQAGRFLKPGGQYAALVFPIGKPAEAGGPPFGMTGGELMAALGPLFRERNSEPLTRSLKRRTWRESWLRAERVILAPAP
ncbi:MAG: SAM-dependent methyltransferase [Planctomycetota bacterium]